MATGEEQRMRTRHQEDRKGINAHGDKKAYLSKNFDPDSYGMMSRLSSDADLKDVIGTSQLYSRSDTSDLHSMKAR